MSMHPIAEVDWMNIYEKAFPVPEDCPPPNERPHCPDCSGIVGETGIA